MENSLLQNVGENIESGFLLPNHKEIVHIIESNMHLAQLDSKSEEGLLKYIRHVAVYIAIRAVGNRDIDPIALGEPYPSDFYLIIAERTKMLQEQFNRLIGENKQTDG